MKLCAGEFLFEEGMAGNKLFILANGQCILSKKVKDSSNMYFDNYKYLNLMTFDKPSIFGEELIF